MTPQERFNLMMSRQSRFNWGNAYVPSVQAVPREAPKGSRISRLVSRKLGRTIHALSTPERVFTQFALFHPRLLDIHEQRVLWPYRSPHPLHGHPLHKGTFFTPVRGTTEIAQEIGFKHHEITVEQRDGTRLRLPFPYLGDLLLYLCGDGGVPYALNWSVKDRFAAFGERRFSASKTIVQQRKDREHAELRTELEEHYYASAGIRTVHMALDNFDSCVQGNLDLLHPMHGLSLAHDAELLNEFSYEVAQAVHRGDPVAYVAISYGKRWGARDEFITRIYQDIWERKLRVNLFEPILIDHPLNTEDKDVLDVYGECFLEVTP